jgi:hypothetical protein
MPELRRQDRTIQAELQSVETATAHQTKYLRLVETLGDFRVSNEDVRLPAITEKPSNSG